MQMEIINIVVVEDNVVSEIKTFPIKDDSFFSKDTAMANEYFARKVEEYFNIEIFNDKGFYTNEIEVALENGYYIGPGKNPITINIIWSVI